ncbi:class I SAM-dependent methyltransferase, partial [Vibrio parahaemolyticus]
SIINYLIDKSKLEDGEEILDFGCGGGILADVILKTNRKLKGITGLDLCSFAVHTAREMYNERLSMGNAFLFGKDDSIDKDDNSIDAIISSFVMHFNVSSFQI